MQQTNNSPQNVNQPSSVQSPQKQQRAEVLREKIQAEVVALITERLKSGSMTKERSQKIAAMLLEKVPDGINYDELMRVVPKLDDEFQELADVVVPIMTEYERKIHKVLEERVLKLVRDKKFKEAMIEARKAIDMEKKLS